MAQNQPKPAPSLGYDDTPVIPGSTWKVHQGTRPQPRVVDAPAYGTPPSDATVLFNGKDLSKWAGRDGDAKWKLEGDHMTVEPGTGSIWTKDEFGDVQLHLEFASPEVVKGDGQGRGNSGVFLQRKYEIQVLDCYNNPTYPDGTVGAIYGQYPPLVNPSREPGAWQTYDIVFVGPRFEGDKLVRPAYMTVFLNGVLIHLHKEMQGPTQHRVLAKYEKQPEVGALELQDHGDLVKFRNIWVRPIGEYDNGVAYEGQVA